MACAGHDDLSTSHFARFFLLLGELPVKGIALFALPPSLSMHLQEERIASDGKAVSTLAVAKSTNNNAL